MLRKTLKFFELKIGWQSVFEEHIKIPRRKLIFSYIMLLYNIKKITKKESNILHYF